VRYDVKVVGAGLAGSVIAERLAAAGRRVLLLERRSHVGGNCFDELDEHGVLVHRYGPHVFRTANEGVSSYLSRFTDWRRYEHRVVSRTAKGLLPIPVNRTTLEKWFGVQLHSSEETIAFLGSLQERRQPERTSEDVCLNRVGRELFEAFFAGYTQKQWGRPASELAAGVCGRIPVRTNRDERYFGDVPFQALPRDGYAAMFDRMLASPNIDVRFDVDGLTECKPDDAVVWTGCVDEAFRFARGQLPWRSLRFEMVSERSVDLILPAPVVNEPSLDVPYTRTTEFRWLTGQKHTWTTLCREYAGPSGPDAEPYYPVPSDESRELLSAYREECAQRPLWTFVGRLAQYRYLEMGQVVGAALKAARGLLAGAQ
jgi:UDP-galactopyranose mutase